MYIKKIKDTGLSQYFFLLFKKLMLITITLSVLSACSFSQRNYPPKAIKHTHPKRYTTKIQTIEKPKIHISNRSAVKQKVGKAYKISGKTYYPKHQPNYNQTGLASWYGAKFHGRKTANGEKYNMYAISAAHKTLPLPSLVKVTNLITRKSIIVRVNDRGPFVEGRIIDLSMAAAKRLGYKNKGVEKVRVEYISPATHSGNAVPRKYRKKVKRVIKKQNYRTTQNTNNKQGWPDDPRKKYKIALSKPYVQPSGHYVQVRSFTQKSKAVELMQTLTNVEKALVQPAWVKGHTVYRVLLGPYHSSDRAQNSQSKIQAKGYRQTFITNIN